MQIEVTDYHSPLQYLNRLERIALGRLVRRLCSTGNPRFRRAMEQNGAHATARMACVNALRLYAIMFFVIGAVAKIGRVSVLAYGAYGLAALCMAWSFWCLYTAAGPEREFKRKSKSSGGQTPSAAA